jgi:hypothetical protein
VARIRGAGVEAHFEEEDETLAKRGWGDLSAGQKTMVLTIGSVQISLLLAALADIYQRPAEEIRGSKWTWTAVSFVNFVGPISYFFFGCKR